MDPKRRIWPIATGVSAARVKAVVASVTQPTAEYGEPQSTR